MWVLADAHRVALIEFGNPARLFQVQQRTIN